MIERILDYIKHNNLVSANDKLLIAVSGGVDSMVLANILHKLKFNCLWAHCNFELRADESEEDEKFVRSEAKKMGVAFYSKQFNTADYALENGLSIQEAARNLRYEWFFTLAEEQGCQKIVTGHHADDRIETLFINLLRGTGLRGMSGIPVKRGNIIRPMLSTFKKEIENYAIEHRIVCRLDRSNESDKYLRNKIRHHVLPEFKKINPEFEIQVLLSMNHIKDLSEILDESVKELMLEISTSKNDEIEIDFEKIILLNDRKVLFAEFLQSKGFNYSVIDQIFESLKGQAGKTFYAEKYVLLKDRNTLILKNRTQNSSKEFVINEPIKVEQPIPMKFEKVSPSDIHSMMDKRVEYFDAAHLTFPLRIRRWKAGDRFIPIGMKGSKKVSDYFVDEKLSLFEKEATWLLISQDKIAWIMGHRLSDEFKITPKTRQAIKITLGE